MTAGAPDLPPAAPTAAPTAMPADAELGMAERVIGHVLRIGLGISLAVVLAGLLLGFAQHPERLERGAAQSQILAPHATIRSVDGLVAGVAALDGDAIAVFGVLLLVATPVARVLASLAVFLRERDRAFAAISATVLIALLCSFLLGSWR